MRLAAALRRGLQRRGVRRRRRARRRGRAASWPGYGDYDAVVLDVMLPGLSGLRGRPDAARRGELGAGADAVGQGRRVRPGRRARLRRRRLPDQAVLVTSCCWPGCGRCCAAARRPRPAVLAAGDLQPRPGHAPRSRWPATPVALTPREFAAAGVPDAHAGRVVSKTELLRPRLGRRGGRRPQRRRGLRRLPAAQDRPRACCETVRGAGYRLARADAASTRLEPAQPAGPADAARRDRAWPSPSRSAAWCCTPCSRSPSSGPSTARRPASAPRTSARWSSRHAARPGAGVRRAGGAGRRRRRPGASAARSTADRLTPLLRPAELARARPARSLIVPGARAGVAGPLRVVAVAGGPAATARDA